MSASSEGQRSCKKRQSSLFVCLEKRWSRADHWSLPPSKEGKWRGRCLHLFLSGRMWENSCKLCWGCLDQMWGKNLFTKRVVGNWNRLSREEVDALCLSMFKRHFCNALNNMFLLWANLEVVRQLDLISVGPCQLELFCSMCVFLDDLEVCGLKEHLLKTSLLRIFTARRSK